MVVSWIKGRARTAAERRPMFERLMAETYSHAFQMAYRFTLNRSEAEDLLQETYLRAYKFFNRYNEELPFTSWLYRIMVNIHIDQVRKSARIRTVSFDQERPDSGGTWEFADPTAHTQHDAGELEEPFQLALKSMTPEFRMAVVLADIDCMSYEEIAVLMDTSVGTVRSRIHRGRKQIREYLESSFPGLVKQVTP